MKKFNFNLEKILELKRFSEEEAKMALGLAIGVLTQIENKIKETALKQHNAASERFKNPAQMLMWNNYIERLQQETEKLMEEAAQAELVVEEKRNLYTEAFRDLKAMEKLKEKKETEYKKIMETKESLELDEIFAARASVL
ncbi:MAG: flagellar export protein FliJ [Treponema sp.]|nr:flagellar export protein FliJ [Treponema sp.]